MDFTFADLSGADLSFADLRGTNYQETTFADVRLNRGTFIGKPDEEYFVTPEELDMERMEYTIFGEEHATTSDSLARAYHALGEAALENGLIRTARKLRIWERKARRTEAIESRDWPAVAGSLLSEYVMGYGVSVRRISVTILFIVSSCAVVYWNADIRGAETVLQALDYSLTTFTGIGSATGPPTAQPARLVAIFESFAGILFSVLLGYILGTRESP